MSVSTAQPLLTLTELAQFAGGDLVAREVPIRPTEREAWLKTPILGASIDTRTLEPGEVFVPLAGGNTDGHRFIEEVWRAVIVSVGAGS